MPITGPSIKNELLAFNPHMRLMTSLPTQLKNISYFELNINIIYIGIHCKYDIHIYCQSVNTSWVVESKSLSCYLFTNSSIKGDNVTIQVLLVILTEIRKSLSHQNQNIYSYV